MSGFPSPHRLSVWEWAQTTLLGANLAWTTLCLGGFRAQTMVVTSALTAALLITLALALLLERRPRTPASSASAEADFRLPRWQPPHVAGWWFIPFLVYAAANVLWVTPVKWLGWFDWFGWAEMIAVFWVVLNGVRSRAARTAMWTVLFVLAVTGVLLGCYQRFVRPDWMMLHRIQADQYAGRASGSFGIPNSFAAMLLLLIPVSGALTFRRGAPAASRIFFGWLTAVLVFGLGLTISRGAWLGLAIALSAWPVAAAAGSWRRRLGATLVVVTAVFAVGALTYATSPRVQERFQQLRRDMGERSRPILWRAAWRLFAARPIVGTGAGSFDTLFEAYRPEGFLNQPHWAHNDYLNTLSDYGALGFGLFFGAAGVVLFQCRRRRANVAGRLHGDADAPVSALGLPQAVTDRPEVLGGARRTRRRGQRVPALDDALVVQGQAIGLLAFALQLFVDFHFKIPALAMMVATVAGLTVRARCAAYDVQAENRESGSDGYASILAMAVAFLVGGVAIALAIVPRYRAEALRETARERIDAAADGDANADAHRERLAQARRELERATALAPDNARAWADSAYATAQWCRIAPAQAVALGAEAELDANRAIALAPVCAEFWIRRGVARDMQGNWDAAGDDFTHAMKLSPKVPLPWFHYAYHLALRPTGRDMAEAMVGICLRLDPKNPDGLRLRQHLATGRK